MSQAEELYNKSNSVTGYLVATLIIISIQVLALFPLLIYPFNLFTDSQGTVFISNIPYLVAYAMIPIFYYITVSLLLNPKRIVSPVWGQTGTIAVLTVLLVYKWSTTNILPTNSIELSTLWQNLTQTIFTWGFVLLEIGLVQLLIVREVVRLSFDGVDKKSYLVNKAPPEIIALISKGFLATHHFEKPRKQGSVWITKRYDTKTKSALILAIGEANSANQTVIATIAYRKDFYVIKKSPSSSDIRDEIMENIKGKILVADKSVLITDIPINELHDDPSTVAFEEARDITISRLGTISEKVHDIPLYFKVMMVLTTIGIVGLALAQLANIGSYTELIITLIVALGLEIGLPLREELRSKLTIKKSDE